MRTLRVLLLQDSIEFGDRVLEQLEDSCFRVESKRTDDLRQLEYALEGTAFDAIVSAFRFVNGTAFEALDLARSNGAEVPFIIVSDDIGEESPASLIRKGISDHLTFDDLHRLEHVIKREIREFAVQREKQEAEGALAESEARLNLALSAAGMGVWEWDLTTHDVIWSPECSLILGISVAGANGENLVGMVVEDDREMVVRAYSRALSDKAAFDVRFRLRRSDGEVIWLIANARAFCDANGRPEKFVGTLRDITREKRSEEALIEAEERYRIVAETASDAIVSVDAESTIIFANPAAEAIFGYERSEMLGQPLSLLIPDRLRSSHRSAFASYLMSGVRSADWRNVETTAIRKDRTEIGVQISFGEFKKQEKHTFTAIIRDVTERKKAADAVRRSEQNFRALVEATTQYVWNLDETGRLIGLPDWWTELTGQSFEDSLNFGWVNSIHPDDRDRVMKEYVSAVSSLQAVDIDVRIRDAAGTYRYYRARAVPVINDDGSSTRWICSLIETTAQRVAEEKLRESEERYRLISSISTDYMYATGLDENGEVGLDWVTGAFEKITGYTQEEFIEIGGWRSIVHPDDLEKDQADLKRLLGNESVVSEIRIVRKNGKSAWIRSYAQPMWDTAAGRVTKICGAVQDITEQKLAESAVRESEDRLRSILNAEPECVKLLDRSGVLLDMNPAGLKMIEADSTEQVVGRKIGDIVAPAHRAAFAALIEKVFRGESANLSFEIVGLKGTRRFLESSAVPLKNSSGEFSAMLAVTRDITERKKAEKFLIESQKRLSELINTVEGIVWEADIESFQFTFVSEQAETILGYPRAMWYEHDFWPTHLHPDDREWVVEYCAKASAESRQHTFEYRMIARDGRVVWFRDIVSVIYEGGKPSVLRGIMVDITDRKKDELELRQRALLIDQAYEAIFVWDLEKGILDWNQGCERMYGYTRDEALGRFAYDILQSNFPVPREKLISDLRGSRYWSGEVSQVTRDGRTVYADSRLQLMDFGGREIVLQTNRDVTDSRLAEIKLRDSEARYRDLFENNPYPMFVYDLDTLEFLAVNDAAVQKYGYSRTEFAELDLTKIRPAEDVTEALTRIKKDNPVIDNGGTWRHKKKDGSVFYVEITSHALDFQGRRARLVLAHDITDRLLAEDELRKKREQLDKTAEACPSVIYSYKLDPNGYVSIPYASPALAEITGLDAATLQRDARPLLERMDREDLERFARLGEISVAELSPFNFTYRYEHPELGTKWIEVFSSPTREQDGSTVWHGIATDITEQKAAEEALRSSEEQLRQAQKLESIGILAGGMAHDFNNMLTAINGYSELILRRIGPDDPIRQNVEEIRKAGERSAELTRQLLAFSRRQILQPKRLDLNEVIGETVTMLRRLIGEDISVETRLLPELAEVEGDQSQIVQVLMNLVLNARDAIDGKGTILIETENIHLDHTFAKHHVDIRPGEYVVLSVSDDGIGMDEETRSRIFEPFFTTKSVGRGTGLGLSTVYGIVKQSGGTIWVYSEPDRGTIFKIYMPKAGMENDESIGNTSQPDMKAGSETILLVEDESTVRRLGREILESCGYSVVEASNGRDAMELLDANGKIVDLMITDVVMPEMGGRELAETITKDRPNIKVLYTSGYTDDTRIRQGIRDESSNFLQKPFTFDALSRKVRDLLDEA